MSYDPSHPYNTPPSQPDQTTEQQPWGAQPWSAPPPAEQHSWGSSPGFPPTPPPPGEQQPWGAQSGFSPTPPPPSGEQQPWGAQPGFSPTPPPPGGQQPWEAQPGFIPTPPTPPQRSGRPVRLMPILLIGAAVIILCGLGILSYVLLPASAATVTLVPKHQTLSQSHTFTTSNHTDVASNLLAARQVSYTTPSQTKKEKTTSTGHLDAAQAKGQLVITPQNATSSGAIKNMIIHGPNGLDVETDEYPYIMLSPNQSTTVPAHIAKAGKVGNVGAFFINGDYNPGDDPGLIVHVSNPAAFSGGRDSYDGPMVESTDLNQVETDLTAQLQQMAQQNLRQELHTGEGLLDMQCTPKIQTQPKSGTPGGTVTAKGTVTCKGTAYDQQGVQDWIQSDMQQAASKQFGPHLGFVRQISSDTTSFTGSIRISVMSDWAVKLDAAGKQALTQAIAGKSQDEAKTILSQQFSSQVTDLSLSGWGRHLPGDAKAIQIVAHDAAGTATPTTHAPPLQAGAA